MAGTLTVLYFDDTDANASNHKWVQLKNRVTNPAYIAASVISNTNLPFHYGGGSPVISCKITDDIGLPLECDLILNNRQTVRKAYEVDSLHPLAFGPNPLANGQVNQFNGLLPELTRIIVHDSSNFMTLFVGRIYKSEEPFLTSLGTTLKLTCFDILQDLVGTNTKGFSTEELNTVLRGVGDNNGQGTTITNGRGNYPYTIARRLDQIKDLILKSTYGTASTQAISYVDHKIDNNSSYIQAFKRDELSDSAVTNNDDQYGKTNYGRNDTDILRRVQILAQSERWYLDASTTGIGFEFFLDATRATPIHALSTVPQQDFTYFRKGHYSTSSPETYGLTAKYALTNSVDDTQVTSNDIVRNMFNDFNFAGFAEDIVTHVAVTHKGRVGYNIDVSGNYDRRVGTPEGSANLGLTSDKYPGVKPDKEPPGSRTDVFTILYINPLVENGNIERFRWSQRKRADNSTYTASDAAHSSDVRALQQVTSLHKTNGVDSGVFPQSGETLANQNAANANAKQFFEGSAKTWIGNIQYNDIDANGNAFIILTEPQDDIIATLSVGDILYERGWTTGQEDAGGTYTPTYSACRFKSSPVVDQQIKKFAYSDITDTAKGGPDEYYAYLRVNVATRLAGGNNDTTSRMRSGMFRIKDWPHMRWTGVAQSGTSTHSLKPVIAANKTPLDYGMRRGCSVIKNSSSGVFAGYISAIDTGNDAVTASLFKTSLLGTTSESTTGAGGWAAGDTYNIYVPLRSGMAIRVDNATAVTVGDHLITSIIYEWDNGHVSSEIGTVGINDKVMYKTAKRLTSQQVPSIVELSEATTQDATALGSGAYEARGIIWWHDNAYGAAPNLAAATLRDYNSFSWSGGLIKVHSVSSHPGRMFKLNPGNTDAALTAAAYTSPMQANKQYVLYFDRNAEKTDGTYDVQAAEITHDDDGYAQAPTFIHLAYLTIGKNEDAGSKEIKGNFNVDGSLYTVNIPFDGSSGNGMGMVNIQFMNTFSNVLGVDNQVIEASRIIQPNSLTSTLLSKGSRAFTSDLSIKPRNNLYNQILWDNGSSGTNATLTFADDDVVTIAAGNTTSGFANNTTNYMYLDGTSAGLTGTLTPQFTTAHGTATGDSKVLLALIVVAADATQKSPTILPLNSKVPTFNATVIAADAIIATHVQAGTLTTNKFTAAAQTSILNSNSDRAKTFAQDGIPTSITIGDLWVDTNDGNKIYRAASVGADQITAGEWVLVNSNNPDLSANINKIFRQASVPTSQNTGDIWIDTDDNAMYFAVQNGDTAVSAIVTSGYGWYRRDDVLAINAATTEISGGLINTARIILKEGGANTDGLFMTGAATFSPTSGQSYIQMDHTSIKGVSRASTTDTTQFELRATDGKAHFIGGAAVIDVDGLTTYTASNQTTKVAKLSTTSGLKLANGLGAGIQWDAVGDASYYSAILNSTAGSTTYGSGGNFHLYSLVNDILIQSTTHDILLYPKSTEGKVSIGGRPLVFLESTSVSNKHGSSTHYTGIWKQAADLSYSVLYRLPTSTNQTNLTGKVLGIPNNGTGSGTVASPFLYDLEWVTNSGSGAGDAFKYITLDSDSGYSWTASGTATADGASDTLKFIATGDIAVWRNTANSNEPAFKFTLKSSLYGNHHFKGDFLGIGYHNYTTELRFYETAGNATHYVGFLPPINISSNVIWMLPATDGSANEVLKTDGNGNLDWVANTDTNTTYSAGTYLELSGTTFNVDLTDITFSTTAAHADRFLVQDSASPYNFYRVAVGSINVGSFNNDNTYMAYGDTSHGTHGGGGGNAFTTVTADPSTGSSVNLTASASDTLVLTAANPSMQISGDATSDTVTFTGNSFRQVVAGSVTHTATGDDTLNFANGSGISISGNAGTDTITIAYTGASSATTNSEAHTTGSHSHTLASGHSGSHTGGTANRVAYFSGSDVLQATNTGSSADLYVNDVRFVGGTPLLGTATNPPSRTYTSKLTATHEDIFFTDLSTTSSSTNYLKIHNSTGKIIELSSTRKVKENIVDLTIDTSKLYDLVPKNFKFKDQIIEVFNDETMETTSYTEVGENSFGMIAEEVHEILPELVVLDKNQEPKSIDYPLLSVLLLSELKKLKARIDTLEGN